MSTTSRAGTATADLSVEDRLAILNLYARYAHLIDSGEADACAATFTPDGILDVSPAFIATGTEELTAIFRGAWDQYQGSIRHNTTNVFVEATPTGARGGAYLILVTVAADDDSVPTVTTTGVYADELVQHDGEWRFAKRQVVSK